MFSPRLIKTLAGVAVLLLVVLVGYLYLQMPHRMQPYAKAWKDTAGITMSEKGASLTFEKKDKEWKVGQGKAKFYAVEERRFQGLQTSLQNLQLEDVISERPAAAAEFDVTESTGCRVTLLNSAGHPIADGIIGKQSPDLSHVYFRFPDSPKIYLGRGLYRVELGQPLLEIWRKTTLLDFGENEVDAITVRHGAQAIDLAGSSGTWRSGGRIVDPTPVYAMLGALAHLRADTWAVEGAPGVPALESLTNFNATLHTTAKTYELHVGMLDAKAQRYPVSSGAETGIGWISEPRLKPVLLKPSDLKFK